MQSSESLIMHEIIKPGKEFFDKFLLHQINNKKVDKRKRTNKLQQNHTFNNIKQSYSVFNLVKVSPLKLSNSQILAGQLLKTNVLKQKKSINQKEEESIKFYQDYEKTQKINKKFTKLLLKPIKSSYPEQKNQQQKVVSFQQVFNSQSKIMIGQMNKQIMKKMEERYHPKPKLMTTKKMLDQSNHKMLYFASDAKYLLKKVQFQIQIDNFTLTFFNQSLQSLRIQLKQKALKNSQNPGNSELLEKLTSFFQSSLPYYLQRSYHQNFTPIPWKSGLLQKEIQKSKYPLITGKVLYKYEHNLILLKENQIKIKVFQIRAKSYDRLKEFIQERISEKRIKNMRKEKQISKERQQRQVRIQKFQKQNLNIRQIIPNENILNRGQLDSDNSKQKDFVSKNLISKNFTGLKSTQPKMIQVNSVKQNNKNQHQSGYNYRSLNNVISINIRNNIPSSGLNINGPNLDQYKFSKNSYFAQHQNQNLHSDKRKNSSIPRNIYMFDHNQRNYNHENQNNYGQFRPQNVRQHENQGFIQNCFYYEQGTNFNQQNNRSKSLKSPSDSNSSGCWNQIRKYQQGKTTKKKKSFMAIKQPRKSQNSFMKVFQSQNKKLMSKKNQEIQFYPLKLGNLILEQNQKAYLEYNCQKQQLKNISMKFLLDRKKHGINKVQLIIPSLRLSNNLRMKINDQQKAKQIIKIILSLGGQIQKVKPQSGYDEQSRKGHLRVSTEMQIYKFYYQDLSYFDIIDSLNIQKQWLQRQMQNSNVNGWKY